MKKITIDSPEAKSADVVSENIAMLKALFPEAFAEDGLDFDVLKQLLGGTLNERDEKYSFTWPEKSKARQIALTPSLGTLRPAPGESVNWETTKNVFIEGDNLEVLKILQKSYVGKIKVIYIDPPYNTGNDLVYNDNFSDNIINYLQTTKQVDFEGSALSSNKESSGRFHTTWLNMMYPRIKLARNLLKNDGIIFISIDDHEVINLRRICDEVFGEENFIALIANINNPKGRSDDKYIATAHDYVLIFAKNKDSVVFGGFEPEHVVIKRYNELDQHGNRFRSIDLRKTGDADRREDRPNMFYSFFFNEKTGKLRVEEKDMPQEQEEIRIIPLKDDSTQGRWRWGIDTARENIHKLHPKFMPSRKIWGVFEKDYLHERSLVKSTSSWTFKDVNSERGSEQFIELGFEKEVFLRPKPVGFMKRILSLGNPNSDSTAKNIILDFFAGSATTAQAIFENALDETNTGTFILVQLPEPVSEDIKEQKIAAQFCESIGVPKNIAEISKERIRRAAAKIRKENPEYTGDLGFKVFKLDASNIRPWNPDKSDLPGSLMAYSDNLLPDRTEDDLLYEVMLKLGLDLTTPMQEQTFSGHTTYGMGQGVLFACLSKKIPTQDVEAIALGITAWRKELNPVGETTVIFRDSAFESDIAKSNMTAILEQYGISNVRSL